MDGKDLLKKLNKPDVDMIRVGNYMKMFDRILLYNIAVHALPKEVLDEAINLWSKAVKRGINDESASRNEFMESSQYGRKAKYHNEPDGESLMLTLLHQYEVAREVILAQLGQVSDSEEEEDSSY